MCVCASACHNCQPIDLYCNRTPQCGTLAAYFPNRFAELFPSPFWAAGRQARRVCQSTREEAKFSSKERVTRTLNGRAEVHQCHCHKLLFTLRSKHSRVSSSKSSNGNEGDGDDQKRATGNEPRVISISAITQWLNFSGNNSITSACVAL